MKAGYLLEQRGERERALKHFLEAKDYQQAVLVLESLGIEFLKMGRVQELSSWIQALPEEWIQGSPWILFYQAVTFRLRTAEN